MANRLLRRPEVEARTGLARSTLYAAMTAGTFPRPVRIGRRAVAWSEDAVERWVAHRPTTDPAAPRVVERAPGAGHSR